MGQTGMRRGGAAQRSAVQHSATVLDKRSVLTRSTASSEHIHTHLEEYPPLRCRWAGPACQEWHLGQCTLEGAAGAADWVEVVRVEGLEEKGAQGMAEMAAAGCTHIKFSPEGYSKVNATEIWEERTQVPVQLALHVPTHLGDGGSGGGSGPLSSNTTPDTVAPGYTAVSQSGLARSS